ncbi:HU family DNA-binding protein [Thauera sp. GDN1]|uniref:HU family DNA-binding protein n=1 Tax=Thauera sp. GDN1 TaxID=2944810 RepID=UPI00247A07BC|nr:HU family DNA-binding protein [Thauera sp. GDN1]
MKKSDLVDRLIERSPALTRREVEASVSTILKAMMNQLAQGSRIEVRDFASLRVRRLGGKLGRNPRTGEAVSVPARYVVRFKPGKRLRDGAVSSVVASNWRKVGAGTQPGATPAAAPPD